MIKKIIFPIIALFALSFLYCSDDLTSDKRYKNDTYYFVTGYLRAGKPVTIDYPIRIGRTIKHSDTLDLRQVMLTENADVKIIDTETGAEFPLIPTPLSSGQFLGYYDPDGALLPEPGKKYKFQAQIDTSIIEGETVIPQQLDYLGPNDVFSADTSDGFPEYEFKNYENNPVIVKALQNQQDDERVTLFFQAYCLEEWQDAEYNEDWDFFDEEKPDDKDEYENPISGEPRRIEFMAKYVPEENGVIEESGYDAMFVYYGRYKFTVYNIDDNFYNYHYKTEGFNFGGLKNAVGFFGSVNGYELYTKILKNK